MARLRVHELAKELNISPKELVDKMNELGIPCKNHMSILSTEDANYLRRFFRKFARPSGRIIDDALVAKKRVIVRKRPRKEETEPQDREEAEQPQKTVFSEMDKPAPEETAEAIKPLEEKTEHSPIETNIYAEAEKEEPEEVDKDYQELEMATFRMSSEEGDMGHSQELQEVSAEKAPEGELVSVKVTEEEPYPESRSFTEEVLYKFEPEQPLEEIPPAEPEVKVENATEDLAGAVMETTETVLPTTAVQDTTARDIVTEEIETAESSEEEIRQRPKRHRRRRRRKPKKEEPAKIIQLPEIIPSTEEEDHEEVLEAKVRGRIIVEDEAPKKPIKPLKKFRAKEDARIDREEREIETPPKFLKPRREEREILKEVSETSSISVAKIDTLVPGTLPPKATKRKIRIEEAIIVGELAHQMGVKATEVIKKLLLLGLPVTVNQAIDFDTASIVASEFGYEVEKKGIEEETILAAQEDRPEDLKPRPPVVTVMGHVDHGKTSLLDAIRHTNVTSAEAGGITQHIGAYHVHLDRGDIVFLDTPGHEAFTAMRARGAKVTDIVILVVAADDGVMQQTIEAINHAKAANVPIIVAINKIDKPNANPDRVKRELSELGLIPEEWGGNTIMVEVSAKKKIGIEDLLEMVLLQAEIMELRANPEKQARGRVIEAKLEKGRGPVATVLIQEGTLRVGDAFVCGVHHGKVRNIFDDLGQRVESAGPSMPVEVIGLSGVPQAGDDFVVVSDEKQARTLAEHRLRKQREREISLSTKVTLEKLYEQIREGQLKELNLILKTDVQGSLEALTEAIKKLSHPEIKINIIHSATGTINETDIMLASASNAIVIGFNVRPDAKVEELAQREKVDVRFYNVIYQLIDDIKAAMEGLLEPEYQEKVLGRAEVRQTFHISKVGTVAGCYVTSGAVQRSAKVRVLRDQVVVYDGKIASLKRFKEDAREVKAGFECGILVENFNDIKVGDVLEIYVMEAVKPSIDSVLTQETREDSQDRK